MSIDLSGSTKDKMIGSIAIISSQAFAIVNFRGPLIQALIKKKFKVYALAPDYNDDLRKKIEALGAIAVDFNLSRAGMNPLRDGLDTVKLCQVLIKLKLDYILSFFVKAVIYGSIAAWVARVPARFAMIEGLGYGFMESNKEAQFRKQVLRKALSLLYKIAIKLNQKVFFLNQDDTDLFINNKLISDEKIVRIDGIGLDLEHYSPVLAVIEPITFIFIARMLKEKGVYDFIEAARKVRANYPQVCFLMVGGVDLNPGSVKEVELNDWVDEGLIEWTGQINDVRPWIEKASVFVLPSYYREGLPRSNQEAMAMSRPVITTNWVGCRETVEHGVNGYLVPIRNPEAIAKAMISFVESPDLINKMGLESRRIAEERFNVHNINQIILSTMGI